MAKPHLTVVCHCVDTGDSWTEGLYPREDAAHLGDFRRILLGKCSLKGVRFFMPPAHMAQRKKGEDDAPLTPPPIVRRPSGSNGAVSV